LDSEGAGQEDVAESVEAERLLSRVQRCSADAGEDASVGGGRDEGAVLFDDDVGPGGLEDRAVGIDEHGVSAQGGCEAPVGPFVAAEAAGEEVGDEAFGRRDVI